ncbi:meiosis protein SPO22/ZIP4 like-domain-containing protein [Aspergillus karnatakaensis]|uniref:uncharacterized protein n=1 Tax=Aspergillus karnatakaensis TaxID=1810916 RepID=UPI003CCD9DA0
MVAKQLSKPNSEEQALLALASDLHNQLTTSDCSGHLALSNEVQELLEKTLHRLPLPTDAASSSIRRQLDNEGTKLWNVRLQRTRTALDQDDILLLCKVSVLAYVMLEAAAPRTGPGNHRCLELAFKVVKACIEHKLLDLSQKMMESAATRLDLLDRSKLDTDKIKREIFTTHYYMLRVYLAWSQGRVDIADHLFSKIPETKTTEQQRAVVDICYSIGNTALTAAQYEVATTWLDRALKVCAPWSDDEPHEIGRSLKDKRLLVLHAYARSNLHLTTAAAEDQLRKAIDLLRTEYGGSFPVLVFSLEVLNRKDTLDEEYFETLMSSIKAVEGGDASVKIVYHYVTRLGSLSLELFVEACGQLLNKLKDLEFSTKEQWMEKIFVSVIWTITSSSPGDNHDPKLAETAAQLLTGSGLHKPSEDATQASLVLIWKYIDTMLARGSTAVAEQWCRFLLKQPIFQTTPDTEAKTFRKVILCVLQNNNSVMTGHIFKELLEECKTCPLTLYLMYRLAVRAEDSTHITACIQLLCKLGDDPAYIWSCVVDALHLGKPDIAIQSLRDLVAVSDVEGFRRMRISELLQFIICTVQENRNSAGKEDSLRRIMSLLKSAMTVAEEQHGKPISPVELRWFSYKSYSIALELYKQPLLQAIIGLLNISVKFMELYQKDMGADSEKHFLDHHLKCTFLQAMITITEARREKSSSKKEMHYKEAREAINQFQDTIHLSGADFTAHTPPHSWLDKYRIILSFNFEATVYLRQWDDLAKIIETSKPIVCAKLSSVFLDCLLRSGAPSSYLSRFVKQLIRTFHSSPSPFINTPNKPFQEFLPRHLRCLFALALKAEEYILAESVLDQAIVLVQNQTKKNKENPKPKPRSRYPEEELQWLATTAFNRAVEFFLVSGDEDCRRWAGKAIALAELVGDKGELGGLLRGNLEKILGG